MLSLYSLLCIKYRVRDVCPTCARRQAVSATKKQINTFFTSGEIHFSEPEKTKSSTVWCVKSGQTRRSLFLGRLRVYTRSDCCSRTVWHPGTLDFSWHCFSSNFVYNFNKTPWFPLMWMVRFVTFVHKDLFPAKTNLSFLVLIIRSRSSNRILYKPANGREISSSVFCQTRCTRLYFGLN